MLKRAGQKEPVPATLADQGSGPGKAGKSAGVERPGFWTPACAASPTRTRSGSRFLATDDTTRGLP